VSFRADNKHSENVLSITTQMPEPSNGEISVEDARARMLEGIVPGAAEITPLADAFGRALAEHVAALRDQPPFDTSAMDGYAIRTAAEFTDRFRVIGESAAGRPFIGEVSAVEAVRIFTGAGVPDGCRVVVQERAIRAGDHVTFEAHKPISSNTRQRGGDFQAGQVLLKAGARLDAWSLALAAAAGRGKVPLVPRPRVAILSTGLEIVKAGSPVSAAQIFDSNGPALAALITAWGGVAIPLEPAEDDEAAIVAAVADVACDLILTVGGASVGDHDLVKPALRRLGLHLKVETVRLRPGKPTWFGVLADGRRVLGLPGNPASALVCAELFLKPLLLAWQGADPAPRVEPVRVATPLPAEGPREHWMRARLSCDEQGTMATPFSDQDSSLITVFAETDALLRRPSGAGAAAAGDWIDLLRLPRL
jgi:molybdopterin molybdotransferase